VVKRLVLYLGLVYHGITTLGRGRNCRPFAARGVEPLDGLMKRDSSGGQIRVRLTDVRVPEQFLDVVKRHSRVQPSTALLSPQIVEVQIDGSQRQA
jgi:hypothetical protein